MLRSLTVLLALSIAVISCSSLDNDIKSTIVNLHFVDDIPATIQYSVPINNRFNYGFRNVKNCPSTGEMTISLDLDKPGFLQLIVPERPNSIYEMYVMEPGLEYEMDVVWGDSLNKIEVSGESTYLQKFIKTFKRPGHIVLAMSDYPDTTWDVLNSMMDRDLEIEIQRIDSFDMSNAVNDDVVNLLKTDRRAYYTALRGCIARDRSFDDDGIADADWDAWSNLYSDGLLDESYSASPWFTYIADNFKDYITLNSAERDRTILQEYYDDKTIEQYELAQIQRSLIGDIGQFTAAALVQKELQNHKYKTELIDLIDQFQDYYPDSEYVSFQEDVQQQLIKYKETDFRNWPKDVSFVAYEEGENLEDLLKKFKGKKLFIDVWATWCGPCLRDFEYNDEVNLILEKKGYQKLYISVDRDGNAGKWEEAIKFHRLKGMHIRLNEKLRSELNEFVGGRGVHHIPRYIIVDENGQVAVKEASRPFEFEKLKAELSSL